MQGSLRGEQEKSVGAMIWISGPPRSGTTMLNLMISGDAYLPECTIVTQLIKLYAISKNAKDSRFRVFMGDGPDLTRNFRDLVAVSLRSVPRDAVLKDPYLTMHLREWRDLFQDERMIVMLRDPRDVVSSMLVVLRKTERRAKVEEAVDFIAPFYAEIEKVHRRPIADILFVRYEDIVAHAPAEMSKLSQFVGRELRASPSGASLKRADFMDASNPYHSDLSGRAVTDERIGAYATTMTEEEVKLVGDRFADTLDLWYRDRVGTKFRRSGVRRLAPKVTRELARLAKRLR
jgi:hypothetical protein